jgi:predicted ATP-binding protein involved in virulence
VHATSSVLIQPAWGGVGVTFDGPRIQGDVADLPICCAYGAGRRLGPAFLSWPEQDDPVANLFFDSAPLRNAEEWLLQVDYSASKPSPIQKRQKDRLGQVQNLLVHILPEVEDIRISEPTQAQPTPRVEFHTPYGWVHLRALGYGYQTLIAWMVDLASRLVERFPDSPDPLAEPAVVLVDEIELHLHPQWQRKLIGHLTACFPNTQFIATAHSPLVVQAAEDANLAVLRREGDRVVIDNDVHVVRGWRIDQIYTSDLFGLESARPPQLDRALARRTQLLSKPTLSAADQRELKELDEQIGSLPAGETAEQAETLRLVRESLELLKKGTGSRP